MKYLTLKCINGSIIVDNDYDARYNYCDEIITKKKKTLDNKVKVGNFIYNTNFDLVNIVPSTMLANILRKLCGDIPVPTKRKTVIGDYVRPRTEVYNEIASNSYIKIESFFKAVGDDGINTLLNVEMFNTNKSAYNSTNPEVKSSFKLHQDAILSDFFSNKTENNELTINGRFDWWQFKSCFGYDINSAEYKECINFLKNIVGYNPEDKSFKDFIFDMSKFWNTEFLNEKRKNFNVKLTSPWRMILFGENGTSTDNHTFNFVRTINTIRGIAYRAIVNAEIIIPLKEEHYFILDKIRENGGGATFLDGGLVFVAGIENYEPIPNFREKYDKIY